MCRINTAADRARRHSGRASALRSVSQELGWSAARTLRRAPVARPHRVDAHLVPLRADARPPLRCSDPHVAEPRGAGIADRSDAGGAAGLDGRDLAGQRAGHGCQRH